MEKVSILCNRRCLNLLVTISMLLGFAPLSVAAVPQPEARSFLSTAGPGAAMLHLPAERGANTINGGDSDVALAYSPSSGFDSQLPVSFSVLGDQDLPETATVGPQALASPGTAELDSIYGPFLPSTTATGSQALASLDTAERGSFYGPFLPSTTDPSSSQLQVKQSASHSDLMFIENVGQFDEQARFRVWGGGHTVWLAQNELWVTVREAPETPNRRPGGVSPSLASPDASGQQETQESQIRRGANFRLSFVGANPTPIIEPFDRLSTHVSYFLGNDPDNWHADVPAWGGVRYVDLYPGVDLEVGEHNGRWGWRMIASDEEDLTQVRLRVEGADALALDGDTLRLTTALGEVAVPLLQAVAADGSPLNLGTAESQIDGNEVATPFAPPSSPAFTILQDSADDLLYSAILGGGNGDYGYDIAMDEEDGVYVAGATYSQDFPTQTAVITELHGTTDAFVAKFSLTDEYTGSLVYATYLGGSSGESGNGIAIDGAGSAYVTGQTSSSTDFPTTTNAYSTTFGGGSHDAFLVKLSADGTAFAYGTYLGGNDWDWAGDITVDGDNSAYVAGETKSDDFPTTDGAYDETLDSDRAGFMVKLDPAGQGQADLLYGTFLEDASANAIAIDGTGSVYLTGDAGSDFYTTSGAYDTRHNGSEDAFVAKLSPTGSYTDDLIYATFLGGSGSDESHGVVVDDAERVYVSGSTTSSDFPTSAAAYDPQYHANYDAFVVKLSADGTHLAYATYLGGEGDDFATDITLDTSGSVYVTGNTTSVDFPTTTLAYDTTCGTDGECNNWMRDAFVVRLNAGGTNLVYATYLGMAGHDYGNGIVVSEVGEAYVVGTTASTDFPTTSGAYTPPHTGNLEAFISVLDTGEPPVLLADRTYAPSACPLDNNAARQSFAGGPINTFTGNYNYQATDLSIPTLGRPLRFERTYNSLPVAGTVVYSRPLGYGWTHNYDVRLVFADDPGGVTDTVVLKTSSGTRLRFADNGDGSYEAYPGVWATLVEAPGAGDTYTVTASNQEVYAFNSQGRLTTHADPRGNEITLTYTDSVTLRCVTGPSGQRWLDFAYDDQNRLESVTDHTDRSVGYEYDANDNLTTITDTLGLTWTYVYSSGTHLLHEVKEPPPDSQVVERTFYDEQGRATSQEDGLGEPVVEIGYPLTYTRVVTEGGVVVTDTYNSQNLLVGQVDSAGNQGASTFDYSFNRDSVTDANGSTSMVKYGGDCGCQPTMVADALDYTTTMVYDDNNNLTSRTDALGRTTSYEYDGNNLTKVTNPLTFTTLYTYNDDGLVTAVTDAEGNTTSYGYDDLGQRTSSTDALGTVTAYQYDSLGRLITTTVATGTTSARVTVNEYDAADQLIKVTENYLEDQDPGCLDEYNLITEYGYDAAGRLLTTTVAAGTTLARVTVNEYDAAGRLKRATENYTDTNETAGWQDEYNLITEYGYNDDGRLETTTVLSGTALVLTTVNEYDDLGRLVQVTENKLTGEAQNYGNEYNLVTSYAYDAVGNQTYVTDTLGLVTRYEYDELNRQITVTHNYSDDLATGWQDEYNLVMTYGYDAVGQLTTTVEFVDVAALERRTVNDYDALGRVVTTTVNYEDGDYDTEQPDQDIVTSYEYDKVGNQTLVTTTVGVATQYEYDELYRQVEVTQNYSKELTTGFQDEYNLVTEYDYDVLGNRIEVVDAEGHTTYYGYDSLGRQTTHTVLSGTVRYTTTYAYDLLGNRSRVTDAEQNATDYGYDSLGRLITVTDALDNATAYVYDAAGNRRRVTDAEGNVTRYGYDSLGRLGEVGSVLTGAVVYTTSYEYDARGNRTAVTDPLTHTTSYGYDSLSRVVTVTNALLNDTLYTYDAAGNRTLVTDTEGIATRYLYDSLNRLAGVTENWVDGAAATADTNVTTTYAYDGAGNRTAVVDARGYTTTYEYDGLNRLTVVTDPRAKTIKYQYDGVGNRLATTDANGVTTTYEYDDLNRLTKIDYPAPDADVSFGYDGVGNRTSMVDGAGTTTYTYDDVYRLQSVNDGYGRTVGYGYDGVGNRAVITYPGGLTVTYGYDGLNRLARVSDWDEGLTTYTYDAAGRLTGVSRPQGGVTTTYEYDDANRLLELAHYDGDMLLARYSYTLDDVGNRVAVTEVMRYPVSGLAALPAGLLAAAAATQDAKGVAAANVPPGAGVAQPADEVTGTLLSPPFFTPGGVGAMAPADRPPALVSLWPLSPNAGLPAAAPVLSPTVLISATLQPGVAQTLAASDGGLTLTVSAGAVLTPTQLLVTHADPSLVVLPEDWVAAGPVYQFNGAHDFVEAITVALSYAGEPSGTLAAHAWFDGVWQALATAVDAEAHLATAATARIERLALLAAAPPDEPQPTPTPIPSPTPTATLTPTPTVTLIPTPTLPPSPTPSPTLTPTPLPTPTLTPAITPTLSLTSAPPTPTPWPTVTPTATATAMPTPTLTATPAPTPTATLPPAPPPPRPAEPGPAAQVAVRLERSWAGPVPADGRTGARLVVLVTDESGNPVADDTGVYLQAYGARVTPDTARTVDGLVFARLQAGTQAGPGWVEVRAGNATTQVTFELVAPEAGAVRVDDGTPPEAAPLPFELVEVVERSRNTIQVPERGLPFVRRDGHRAYFDSGSLLFEVLGEEEVARPPTMTVALAGVYAGREALFEGPSRVPVELEGNAARFEWAPGLVEEYVARDAGVEQRLWIERLPDATEDLTVVVEVETALSLARAEGGKGFVFRAVDGETGSLVPVAGYGRALALDADGRAKRARLRAEEMEPETPGLHRYRLEMAFPAEWLAGARYPLLVDPLIGGLLQLDSALTQAGDQAQPAVAYNSQQGEYLVVWQDDREGDDDVYGQLVSADGLLVEENFTITEATGDQAVPDVAYNADDDSYLAVWRSGTSAIKGQIVQADGTLSLTTELSLGGLIGTRHYPAVAYSESAERWLVAWQESAWSPNYAIMARAVDGSGSLGTTFTVYNTTFDETLPDVAANDDGDYLVVWEQPTAMEIQLVYGRRTTTSTVDGDAFAVSDSSPVEVAPRAAYNADDDHYLVVWEKQGTYDTVRGRRVLGEYDEQAGQFAGDTFQVSDCSSVDCGAPDVTYYAPMGDGDGSYLVAWQQQAGSETDLQARRVLTSGTPSGKSYSLCDADDDQGDIALGFGPAVTETLAAWTDGRAGNEDVRARTIEPDGTLGNDYLVHPVPGDQNAPQAAYNPDDDEYLVVWHDYRLGSSEPHIYGQRVSGDGLLAGDNITITSATHHQTYPEVAYADDGGTYLTVWRRFPGAMTNNYDVYGQIISPTGELVSGTLHIAGRLSKESPTDIVYNSASDEFLVLWQDLRTGYWNIWGRHVATTGTMDPEFQITFMNSKHETWAAGAYNPDDDQYLVVYQYRSAPGQPDDVRGRRMTGSGTVTSTETINVATGSADQWNPDTIYLSAALNPGLSDAGRYAVVWEDDRGSDYDVYGQLVSPTGSLDGSNYVVSAETGDERFPRLTLDDSGGALAVWQRDNGGASENDLYGRWLGDDGLPAGGGFSLLEADDEQQRPAIAGDGAGGYLLAWQDDRNGDWDIYASRFAPLRAGFTATPTVGTVPLRVEFTDASAPTGTADEWLWSLSDGVTSTLASPVYTYTQAGVYTVTQWVTDTDTGETDALTCTHYITVTQGGDLVTTTVTYDYDPLYRLITATYSGGEEFEYAYDEVGNRTAMTETLASTEVTTYTYDEANRLTKVGDVEYDWDDNGNLLDNGVFSYTYDYANRLVRVEDVTTTVVYTYNGDGHRMARAEAGEATTYTVAVLGLSQVLVETRGGESIVYLYGHDLLAEEDNTWQWHLGDGLGSVRQLVDGDGDITLAQGYTPFGVPMWDEGNGATGYGFTGER